MKKSVKVLIAAFAMASCVTCLAACHTGSNNSANNGVLPGGNQPNGNQPGSTVVGGNNKENETFEGVVSTQSYSSGEDAAAAFIANEIQAENSTFSVEQATKESTLSATEIADLGIKDEKNEIESVEKWRVRYQKSAKSPYALTYDTDDSQNYVTVYIIKYKRTSAGNNVVNVYEYKYFVPLPDAGDALSISYFKSVLDPDKYKNCTITATSSINTSMSYSMSGSPSQNTSVIQTVSYVMYVDNDVAKVEYTVTTSGLYDGTTTTKLTMYLKQVGNTVKGCLYVDGVYNGYCDINYYLGCTRISDLYMSQLSDAEYSYYVKTDFGFELNKDRAKELLDAALEEALEEVTKELDPSMNFNMKSKEVVGQYYVKNGVVDHAIAKVGFAFSFSMDWMSMNSSSNTEATCYFSDFGTTTVELSEEVLSHLK